MRAGRQFALRKGEVAFVNGAIVRAPGGALISVLNDANFLAQDYLMQESEMTTPLRRLYGAIQREVQANPVEDRNPDILNAAFAGALREAGDPALRRAIVEAKGHVLAGRPVEALKRLKKLFPFEAVASRTERR